ILFGNIFENRTFGLKSFKMQTIKKLGILLGIFLFTGLNAQEVTDYDLQNFAKAYKDMVEFNTKAQNEMAKIIADEGLDLEVYHAIDETRENSDVEPDVPQTDFDKYKKVQQESKKIKKNLKTKLQKGDQRQK